MTGLALSVGSKKFESRFRKTAIKGSLGDELPVECAQKATITAIIRTSVTHAFELMIIDILLFPNAFFLFAPDRNYGKFALRPY